MCVGSHTAMPQPSAAEGDPVLKKVNVADKVMPNGSAKHRVILDCKSSRVSAASWRSEHTVLPRTDDVVFDTLDWQAAIVEGEHVEFAAWDVSEAFCRFTRRRGPGSAAQSRV